MRLLTNQYLPLNYGHWLTCVPCGHAPAEQRCSLSCHRGTVGDSNARPAHSLHRVRQAGLMVTTLPLLILDGNALPH